MIIKNMNLLNNFSPTIYVVQCINLFLGLYYLIINKTNHFKEIYNAMLQSSIIINEKRVNISKSYRMTISNEIKPKHFVIKSILYQYIIRARKKYSDLT